MTTLFYFVEHDMHINKELRNKNGNKIHMRIKFTSTLQRATQLDIGLELPVILGIINMNSYILGL